MISELAAYSDLLKDFSNIIPLRPGGQKKVFCAEHLRHGKVVIKVSKCIYQSDFDRLKRELDFLRKNSTDSFPRVFYYEFNDSNKDLIVIEEFIEHIEFTSIRSYYNNEIKVITLLHKLITILEVLWKNNIIHRDLKPDNILITPEYSIRIIDLGIARFLNETSLTQTLQFMGPCTPFYASPEQLRNDKNIIDIRTDFFSLGIIISEIFLGFHPFDPKIVGRGSSIPENILTGNRVNLLSFGASENFSFLLNKMLALQQFKRFRTFEILNQFILSHWEVT